MENAMNLLEELRIKLEAINGKNYKENQKELRGIQLILNRSICRIYPEKDAEKLVRSMTQPTIVSSHIEDIQQRQKRFNGDVDRALDIIKTIKQEYKVFGLEDFTPTKQKIKTELQIGSSKVGYYKKTKTQ